MYHDIGEVRCHRRCTGTLGVLTYLLYHMRYTTREVVEVHRETGHVVCIIWHCAFVAHVV